MSFPMTVKIGITTSLNDGEQRLDRRYIQAIERAGGLPMIVPMMDGLDHLDAFADLLDGLVITGGPAVTDGLVGALPEDLGRTDPARVRADKRVLQRFLHNRRPVLGICYGMQLLNAQFGGTIYADVEHQQPGTLVHAKQRGGTTHPLVIDPTSHLYECLGRDQLDVNTRHVQAVERVGRGLRVSATAPDGVIEAIESADGRLMGMQFHPERMPDDMAPLFTRLVHQASTH